MKKKIAVILLTACLVTACGGSSQITTGNKPIADAVYTNDHVSLADYTNLKAEKKNYMITEKTIEDRIHEDLQEFAEYNSVSRPSQSKDYVQTDFKASIDGKVVVEETQYDIILGAEEFGKEFDEKLTNVSVGDELAFSLNFDNDFTDVEWAGNTVDFEIRVTDIQEELLPEPTDAFIRDNTSYGSYEEYIAAVRTSLEESFETESIQELQETLIQQVMDNSSMLQYTKDDYEQAKDTVNNAYLSYLDIFGMDDLDDVYEFLDVTKEDVEEEIQENLYRTLTIQAIIENEKFSLSDEEYEEGIRYYMEQTETESREEFLKTYGEDEIRAQLLEDKVLNFLVNQADITETDAEYDE